MNENLKITRKLLLASYCACTGKKYIEMSNVKDKLEFYNVTINLPGSDDVSFNIKKIIINFVNNYGTINYELKSLFFEFQRKVIEPTTTDLFQVLFDTEVDELKMIPAFQKNLVIDGTNILKYTFFSNDYYNFFENGTYLDWINYNNVDSQEDIEYLSSISIYVEDGNDSSILQNFFNKNYVNYKNIFLQSVDEAKFNNDFSDFNLYHPFIYSFELSDTDRILLLDKLVYSTNWNMVFENIDGINGYNEFEIFKSLLTNVNSQGKSFIYDYIFQINIYNNKTNFENFNEILPGTLKDFLYEKLIKFFYDKHYGDFEIFKNQFSLNKLYPVGYLQDNYLVERFNLANQSQEGTIIFCKGVKYRIKNIVENSILKLKIFSATVFTYNYLLQRCELINLPNRPSEEVFGVNSIPIEYNFDTIIYITPYPIPNNEFRGIDLPSGSVLPIPAFAFEWLNEKNENIYDLIDYIGDIITTSAIIFPLFKIFQFGEFLEIFGLALTFFGNALDAGLKNQIEAFDNQKSISTGSNYTKGKDFIAFYYIISTFYGGINLAKAVFEAPQSKKIKVLLEHENLLGAWSIKNDFENFLENFYPSSDRARYDALVIEMNKLEIDYQNYKFLKK